MGSKRQIQEASSSTIELHGDDPDALEGMIRFFYGCQPTLRASVGKTETVAKDAEDVPAEAVRLSFVLRVYVAADKYDVAVLRKQLASDFEAVADAVWKKPQFFADGFLEKVLRTVYSDLPERDGLRLSVATRMSRAISHCHNVDSMRLSDMLEHLPDLAKDVVMQVAAQRPQEARVEYPLHRAAQSGDLEECRRLIEGGQEVDALDRARETPLHFATWYGRIGVARLLITSGADVNATSETYPHGTPLSWATCNANAEMTRLLEEAGAQHLGSG